jgi:hypothetical protein
MPKTKELKIMTHNGNSEYQHINVDVISDKFGAIFIGDFSIKTKTGAWSALPVAVFYQPNPALHLGHTHYFGIFNTGGLYQPEFVITDASSAFSEPILGIVADDGEVIFSRSRHDFRTSKDGSVSIDGGREYIKYNSLSSAQLVNLIIDKDKLVIDNTKQVENSMHDISLGQLAQEFHSTSGEKLVYLITNFLDDKDSCDNNEYYETDYQRAKSVMQDFQSYLEKHINKVLIQQHEQEINEAISYLNKFGYEIKQP